MPSHCSFTRLALVASLVVLSACAPSVTRPAAPAVGLPPIPEADGPLQIQVVHPTPTTVLPRVDSTYIYGSVGTGRAELTINGTPVPVAPNGAFVAYLPVPANGEYQLSAAAGGRTAALTRAYRPAPAPTPGGAPRPAVEEFPAPRLAVVTGGADTLATGSDVAIGRPTPGGTYRWFLPRGARVAVTGRLADQLRVRLDTATAWFAADALSLQDAPPPVPAPVALTTTPAPGWVDLRFAAAGAPFLVEPDSAGLRLTLYGRTAAGAAPLGADPLLASVQWSDTPAGRAVADVRLADPLWGYKAFYEPDGTLVLRVRRPPRLNPADPLRGARILIDPGHPPGGATGPTGLTEAEANLAISLRLAERLRQRGAAVVLTRGDASAVGLGARVDRAVSSDAHLLVSVHNNAFPEGVNPFRNNGTSVYYFHPFSAPLARALNREIVETTRIRDLGARQSNLALVRPTWMPSALTESLYMLIPEQEAALRDPAFLDRLAAAHVRGIEAYLRNAAGRQPSSSALEDASASDRVAAEDVRPVTDDR